MAVEQAPGGGGVGRRILAEERPGEFFSPGLLGIQESRCRRELLMCLL